MGNGIDAFGESSNIEVNTNHGPSATMQRSSVLQGGYLGHSEVYDNMDARLESFQKPLEEDGMEYGGVGDSEC